MKIRNRHLVRFAGRAGALLALTLKKSLRFEYRSLGEPTAPTFIRPDNADRYLYSVWHENLLLPTMHVGDATTAVLISKHADGQILGSLIDAVGMGMVLGSSNRGGVEAVRKLLDVKASRRHLAVTPDGPRGPRRVVQPGIIYIASRTGMKIVCAGVGYHNPWRMKSWDRFAIPKPTSRAKLLTATPIVVPPRLKLAQLEDWRLIVQSEMDRINALAEEYAATNRFPQSQVVRRAA